MMKSSLCAVAFAAAALVACDDLGPKVPVGEAVFTIGAHNAIPVRAGEVKDVSLALRDPEGNAVKAGVHVRWTVPAGSLNVSQSFTDTAGVARVSWTVPTLTGTYRITAVVDGQLERVHDVEIVAGPPVRVVIDADTIRISRFRTYTVGLRIYDAYDNRLTLNPQVSMRHSGPLLAQPTTDSLSLTPTGAATTPWTGSVGVSPQFEILPLLDEVTVVLDIPVTIDLIGATRTWSMAVGDSLPFELAAHDPDDNQIAISFATSGVTLTTGDAAILAADSKGFLVAKGAGTTTVTATHGSTQETKQVTVAGFYDLGAPTTFFTFPGPDLHTFTNPPSFAPAGNAAVQTVNVHSTLPPGSNVRFYNAAGTQVTSRFISGPSNVARGANNGWLTARPLTAYDANGAVLWSRSEAGSVVRADTSLVAMLEGAVGSTSATLRAFTPAGEPLWSSAQPVPWGSLAITPARVYVSAVGNVHAFDRSGTKLWTAAFGGAGGIVDEASWIFAEGTTSEGGRLRALDADGTIRWSRPSGFVYLALGPNNSLIVKETYLLRSLDRATGAERWAVMANPGSYPSVQGNLLIFPGSGLHVYDAATGQKLGRTQQATSGGSIPPTCTAAGLIIASFGTATRFPKCQ